MGNGFTPDLRISGVLGDKDAWASVVTGGALKEHGMVGFASQLSPEQVENIRHYVVNRSIWTKKNLPEMTAPQAR